MTCFQGTFFVSQESFSYICRCLGPTNKCCLFLYRNGLPLPCGNWLPIKSNGAWVTCLALVFPLFATVCRSSTIWLKKYYFLSTSRYLGSWWDSFRTDGRHHIVWYWFGVVCQFIQENQIKSNFNCIAQKYNLYFLFSLGFEKLYRCITLCP